MYENYKENLLDKCNQRLLCCKQRVSELTEELRKAKVDLAEVVKLGNAIQEV